MVIGRGGGVDTAVVPMAVPVTRRSNEQGFGNRNRSNPYASYLPSLSRTLPPSPPPFPMALWPVVRSLFIARTRPVHNINMLHLWPHLLATDREFLRNRPDVPRKELRG